MPIRVFISSTFRDMHAERDYLSRLVFPELRSRCQKRGAEFIGLDLRWGVTQEEAQREGALKLCLDEIERCRPFFVCLLGSRYGWVPPPEEVAPEQFENAVRGAPPIAIAEWYALDETSVPPVYRLRRDRPIPEDVADALARFWEHARLPAAGESITAREILRGVFEEGFPATHALFYLRKPGIEAAPAFPPAFVPVFVEPDPNRRDKLHDLETKIRDCKDRMVVRDYGAAFAGLRIEPSLLPDALSDEERAGIKDGAVAADKLDRFSASVRQVILDRGTVELSGLETLGDRILEDLWTAIEKELARPAGVLDQHQRERAYHERFVIDRTRLFLGRDELVKRVVDGLADPAGGNLMAVTGAPGSGKSALLAECARRARERLQGALVIPHFIGASPGSAILVNTLRSICETLKRECGLKNEVPADPQKLVQQLPEFLEKAGARKRVVLFLDALNQLDPLDHSHELGWIPYRMPRGVTLVVSALPGECLDRLRIRVSGERVIDVPVLGARDRQALVETHLGQRGKKLSPVQLERLLDTAKRPEAGLPLYLLVALEELSLFGSYQALGKRIELLPPTVAEIFDQVLERLEHDHGRDTTESICRWIAGARSGMLESEILDLLAGGGQVFPRARWSRFYRALEPYLRPVEEQTGEGLLAFYHDQLRFAVYRRYLRMQSPEEPATDAFREVHAELARYFRRVAIDAEGEFPKWRWEQKRGLSELPHHQLGAGMWDALEKTLTDVGFVEAKSRTGMVYDLIRDYAAAERAWPGREEERRHEDEWQRRMQGYAGALIAYSQAHTARREGRKVESPPLPEPPPSVARTSEPEVVDCEREWTAIERIQSWGHLVSNHTVALASGQEPAFQVAYNNAGSGPVADAIEHRLQQGDAPARPWLRLTNRPPFFLRPACLKTLEIRIPKEAFAVSSDGRRAVSGNWGNTLCVWDLETGHSRVLQGHTDSVRSVAVTPDGRRAVSGSKDNTLRVWDLETGHSRVFEEHSGSVHAVALTPDGRRAVSAGGSQWDDKKPLDCNLRVWDLETGRFRVLKGHTSYVHSVAVTPDGRRVVSCSYDNTERVWDVETGSSRVLEGFSGFFLAVAMTPDGRRAVLGGRDVCVWDLDTSESRPLKGHTEGVAAVAVTPDGRLAVTGSFDCTLRVWDLETGGSRVLEAGTEAVYRVAITPDGRRAFSVSSSGTVRVWDLETGNSRVLKGHGEYLLAVVLTPDGPRTVYRSDDNIARVWDLDKGHPRVLDENVNGPTAVTPDGRRAVGGHFGERVWDLQTGRSRVPQEPPHTYATAVAVTPDGRCVLSGIDDKTARVWDLETGASRILRGHTDRVRVIAVTPDGRRAVSGSNDHTMRIWDLETGDSHCLDVHHTWGVGDVAVTPDGRRAVSETGPDSALRIWNLETGRSRILKGHTNLILAFALTPDGRRAVTVSNDQSLRIWDLDTDRSRALTGHRGPVNAVAVTPDGRRAVSGSSDMTLRVWDLETGENVATHTSATGLFQSVPASLFPMLVAGTKPAHIEYLRLMWAQAPLPLLGPRVTTAARLWLCAQGETRGRWDDALTAACGDCGQRFPASSAVLDAIAAITRDAGLGPDDNPFPVEEGLVPARLPAEAWEEPCLLGECPLCHEPLKFNPFLAGYCDRWSEQPSANQPGASGLAVGSLPPASRPRRRWWTIWP
jgi:WD40 repeat protein